MFVEHRFELAETDEIRSMTPEFGFNGFGEFIFYRTYSRLKKDGEQENWADVVIRCIDGVFSIRKDWYIKNHIHWDESFWQNYAYHMAVSMFKMEWTPPGRGLWAMGTDFIYETGSMALFNCAFTTIGDDIGKDINWLMDCLMLGVGASFEPIRNDNLKIYNPKGSYDFIIDDSREGWIEATERKINCYLEKGLQKPKLIYDKIRSQGLPIKRFGGISSGPEPLIKFHNQIDKFFEMYGTEKWYDSILLKTDLANCTGCCVIVANVRRSAELCSGKYKDIVDLKNYKMYPYRESHGWMSNNSVSLEIDEDFDNLPDIAESIKTRGEPGFINLQNFPYGRIGKKMRGLRKDEGISCNPCAEIVLLSKETCNLSETYPTKCFSVEQWYKACEYASLYSSTVTLLPTHRQETNEIILKNRRIGVGITGIQNWRQQIGTTNLIKYLRVGYKKIRKTNKWVNSEAGIPISIRVTTVKPSGTVSKLAGVCAGAHHPTFGLTLRRVRIGKNLSVYRLLAEAGVPHESDVFSANTEVFEWPIDQSDNGNIKPAAEVSIWEQAMTLVMLQREWSDNAVSNTLYFRPKWNLVKDINLGPQFYGIDPTILEPILKMVLISWTDFLNVQELETNEYRLKLIQDEYTDDWKLKVWKYDPNHEEDSIENVLAAIAPLTKSVSVLPHSVVGAYRQMPEEGLTQEEYNERLSKIKKIDWSKLSGSDGIDEKYCEGPTCGVI